VDNLSDSNKKKEKFFLTTRYAREHRGLRAAQPQPKEFLAQRRRKKWKWIKNVESRFAGLTS